MIKSATVFFITLAITFLAHNPFAFSQLVQNGRFEITLKPRDEGVNIIPFGDRGLATVRPLNEFTRNKQHWEVVLLDTALKVVSTRKFLMEDRHPMIGYETRDGYLYLLFREGESSRNNLILIEIDTQTESESVKYDIKPELDFRVTHFSKVASSIVMGGYVSNDPAVLLFDFESKSIRVVPGFFQEDNELVELRVNENETFNVVLIDRSDKSDRKLIFRTFDMGGKILLEDIVPIDEDKSLQTSISSSLIREDLSLFGTWGDRQGKQSLGFFSLPVDPFSDQKIQYYHFGMMDHFVDYINSKRAARIRQNTEESIKAGRKPSFTAHVLPYSIREDKDGYVLMAEVYNPTLPPSYPTSPYGPYSATNNWNPYSPYYYPGMRVYRPSQYSTNVKNEDDIETYATIAAAFGPQGNLLWDFCMKLDDVERPSVEQVGDFVVGSDSVYFVYKDESTLKVKTFHRQSGKSHESEQKIQTLKPSDEIRHERKTEGGVRYWTGDSFFIWGYQTIRDNDRKYDRSREIFYINKLVTR